MPFSEPHLPIVRCVVLANDAVLKVELIYLFIIIFFLEINFSQVFSCSSGREKEGWNLEATLLHF